jgi:NodT family efflux transporter outer membrane factor (OMF) lipoprotein
MRTRCDSTPCRRIAALAGRVSVAVLAGALAACAAGPNFKRPAPPGDQGYGSAPIRGQTAATKGLGGGAQRFVVGMDIPAEWWTLFRSPPLTRLVEQSLRANPDVAAARAALRQARELDASQRGTFFPQVQAGFSATRAKNAIATISNPTSLPQSDAYYNLYTPQVSVSYMPDIFGGTRRAAEATRAQAESARFELEATYVTLSSNVVVTAVGEASLRGQIEVTEQLLALQHRLTQTVRGERKLGTASDLDLLTQETAEAQTAAALPVLRKELGQTRDALTALLGRLPAEEPAETFHLQDLTLPHVLPVTLPSRLVEQRPDVRSAEENLHTASAEAGVALTDMLPQLELTADTGSAALEIGKLFSPYTGFWTVGASLSQTLFQGGALVHRRRAADAALDEAAAQYRAAVILACQNVADALRALQADAQALKDSAVAEHAAKAAFVLAQRQYKLGAVSFVTVLAAEQTFEQAELTLIQAQAARFADTAALFQALGGGWWNGGGDAR